MVRVQTSPPNTRSRHGLHAPPKGSPRTRKLSPTSRHDRKDRKIGLTESAQVRLAEAYFAGAGVPRNPTTALSILRTAADAGNSDAARSLIAVYRVPARQSWPGHPLRTLGRRSTNMPHCCRPRWSHRIAICSTRLRPDLHWTLNA